MGLRRKSWGPNYLRLGVGVESPFGPVHLATGLAEGGEKAFYLYLGKTF